MPLGCVRLPIWPGENDWERAESLEKKNTEALTPGKLGTHWVRNV